MRAVKDFLVRYWIRFTVDSSGHYQDYGVTAYSRDDALALLREHVFSGPPDSADRRILLPPIEEFVENVDVSTLDQNHVIPNMGDCSIRGIWWPPLGYTADGAR